MPGCCLIGCLCMLDGYELYVFQVQMAVHELRESANSRTSQLQQEMSTMQHSTSSIKSEWTVHMEKTESNHLEDTSAVESGKKELEEVLHNWYILLLQSLFPLLDGSPRPGIRMLSLTSV